MARSGLSKKTWHPKWSKDHKAAAWNYRDQRDINMVYKRRWESLMCLSTPMPPPALAWVRYPRTLFIKHWNCVVVVFHYFKQCGIINHFSLTIYVVYIFIHPFYR